MKPPIYKMPLPHAPLPEAVTAKEIREFVRSRMTWSDAPVPEDYPAELRRRLGLTAIKGLVQARMSGDAPESFLVPIQRHEEMHYRERDKPGVSTDLYAGALLSLHDIDRLFAMLARLSPQSDEAAK